MTRVTGIIEIDFDADISLTDEQRSLLKDTLELHFKSKYDIHL